MRIKYSLLLLIIFIGFSTSAQKTDKEKQMEKENQVKKEQADAKKEQSDKEYNKKIISCTLPQRFRAMYMCIQRKVEI